MNHSKSSAQSCGFSLVEVLITSVLLVIFFLGAITFFIQVTMASQSARDQLMALTDAQTKLEEIRNYNFDDIPTDYAVGGSVGASFAATQIAGGRGWVQVDATDPDAYVITIYMHWRDRYGRHFGEDVNLNGAIDPGEDSNADGQLNSDIKLEALLSKKI